MNKTILLFGGNSDEKLVSVASAQNLAVHFAFDELWFVFTNGQISKVEKSELIQHEDPFKTPFEPSNQVFANSLEKALPLLMGKTVFIGFHGTEGEDGSIQSLLESKRIAYTGSGSHSSHLCFEKTTAKEVLQNLKVNVAPQLIIDLKKDLTFKQCISQFFLKHKKIVIKPIANGSSIGLNIISDETSLQSALLHLTRSKQYLYLAEKFIHGRELTIGVISRNNELLALPPSEVIITEGSSFDYEGKYLGKNTREITPAELTPEDFKLAQNLAIAAHKNLKCYGYSRTDAILSKDGLWYLETNTLPGVTKASFIPQQLHAAKISMSEFINEQLRIAELRYEL